MCIQGQLSDDPSVFYSSAIGGYRVYKESIPFESKTAQFKCGKCCTFFTTDTERKQHETSRMVPRLNRFMMALTEILVRSGRATEMPPLRENTPKPVSPLPFTPLGLSCCEANIVL